MKALRAFPGVLAVSVLLATAGGARAYEVVPTDGCNDGFALYVSSACARAFPKDARLTDPGETQEPLVRYCHRRGYGISVVKPDTLADLGKYRIVFLAGLCAVSDAEAAAFRTFVQDGGLLVADTDVGVLDGSLAPRTANPVGDLFGEVLLGHLDAATSRTVTLEMPDVRTRGKGGALKFGFTLAAALRVRREAAVDAYLDEIFLMRGLSPKATCSGLGAAGVFRARQQGDAVLAGFKTSSDDLGKPVTVDFGREGFVYACGKGPVGRVSAVEIAALDAPQKLYVWFASEQPEPAVRLAPETLVPGQFAQMDTSQLRKGARYRLEVTGPDGKALPEWKKHFSAGKSCVCPVPFSADVGDYVLRVTDVLTGLSCERTLTVR